MPLVKLSSLRRVHETGEDDYILLVQSNQAKTVSVSGLTQDYLFIDNAGSVSKGLGNFPKPPPFTQNYTNSSSSHNNLTSSGLVDNVGGNITTTLDGLTGINTINKAQLDTNLSSLIVEINRLRNDIINLKQVVNAIIDGQQQYGWFD